MNKVGIIEEAISTSPAFTVPFPATDLSKQLEMVARLIAGRQSLNVRRQTFFVAMGGVDTHGEQLVTQASLLSVVDSAIHAFQSSIEQLGLSNNVVLFTASDFGRTFSPNASGTDHGWGGNHFILGGGIPGGRIFGTYPELLVKGRNDTERGRWIPTTSVEELSAPLARWMGVSEANIRTIFVSTL